jgi:hypothetical protein
VDEAVEYWRAIARDIRLNPVGDNFDLSRFSTVLVIVCTPFVVYSDADETLAFVDDRATQLRLRS